MGIKVITFQEKYRKDFIRLNTEWIERYFKIEESDLHTFKHIDDYIIRKGGQIFIALNDNDKAIGCCALINHPEQDCHELAKMAVSPAAQGQGTGRLLGETLIAYARKHGAKRIFLEGNTALPASIILYKKLGFQEVPLEHHAYDRCNILMELVLTPA